MNKDLNIIKRLFKILKTPKKSFDQRLIFYQETFNQYKDWRLKYKFPKTKYLSNLSRIKYKPSDKLIRNLSKSISELREEYINLKNYKSIILFKLFLFYFAEVFKIRHKYKLNKSYSGPFSYYFTQGKTPTRRDLDDIMNMVTSHFNFEYFLSNKEEKTKPGHVRKTGDIVGSSWDWVKKKNFKWNSNWKKHKKAYGYQKKFATKDHNKENISLPEIQKLDENYQRLISINKQKDSIHIAHLFYELSYCKDFDKIENLFNNKNEKSIEKNNDWLPRDNEKGKDGNAIPHFHDGGGAYKKRVFPQFTTQNLIKRFNKDIFLKHLLINKDVKASLVKGLNGDPELEYAFEYDEILPEVDLILPAYTSGSIFNFLDKSLSFLTIYRTSSVILELAESFSNALGVLLDNENKRAFLISYSSKRDGTTDCYFEKILDYKNFKMEINNSINKEVLEEVKLFAPDNLILNKEFKFNLSKIIKKLKPLTLQKRKEVMSFVDEDEYDEKKELQKKTGTYIYLLNTKQINNQISSSKMDGSIRFSFPKGKGGKPNFMGDAKLSYQSEIEIKAKHFV